MGDADIADLSRRLHLPQGREMRLPIEQVVDLDQVQDRALHPLGRAPHLRDAGVAAAGPYFGRENTRGLRPASATRSPVTSSARPYIGEESIIRPPGSVSCFNTARNGCRARSSAPASKTCQVPSPITGMASPEDGIGRVIIVSAAMTFLLPASPKHANAEAVRQRSRRSIG